MPPKRAAGQTTLVVLLTLAAAFTDATTYLGLNRAFPANMTGNTVLLGLAIAAHKGAETGGHAAALAGFVLGAAVTAVARPQRGWSRLVAVGLVGEAVVLAGAGAWWLSAGPPAAGAAPRYGLLAVLGAAMGVQSGLVSRVGVAGVATTYITGTWTTLSAGVVRALRHDRRSGRESDDLPPSPARGVQAAVVVTYLVGAAAGGVAYPRMHGAAPLVPVVLLLLAAAGVARLVKDMRRR
jgi:uncharacterized membrane protein YoaK (UPF0700 family)